MPATVERSPGRAAGGSGQHPPPCSRPSAGRECGKRGWRNCRHLRTVLEWCMACTLHVAWDDKLAGYDFGSGHPLAPVRVKLTIELARAFRSEERRVGKTCTSRSL